MKLPPQASTLLRSLKKHSRPVFSVVAGLGIVGLAGVAWVATGKILTVSNQTIVYDHTVESISGNDYTVAGGSYDSKGVVAGYRSDGSRIGVFGKPSNIDDLTATSTRTLQAISGSPLQQNQKISMQGNMWISNPKDALGLDYKDVKYASPVGDMSAWEIPGSSSSIWTIGIHGIGADKTEMLRMLKPVHDAGSTMLVINYRNDANNPAAPDGRNNLGNTEWQDVEAAVAYAQKQGATKINLYGNSLGSSLLQNYLRRGNNTQNVNRVVMDSPALDWENILRHRAGQNGFPQFVYQPTAWMLRLRAGIDVAAISTQPEDIKHPTLIIHSNDDQSVPQAPSKKIAEARSDIVTLLDFGQGGHLRSWNNDQVRYEKAVREFLSQ